MPLSDNDLREEVLRRFSTERLANELERRGWKDILKSIRLQYKAQHKAEQYAKHNPLACSTTNGDQIHLTIDRLKTLCGRGIFTILALDSFQKDSAYACNACKNSQQLPLGCKTPI